MFFAGSSVSEPSSCSSYCMNTRFQNSRKRSVSSPGRSSSRAEVGPAVEVELRARPARPGRARPARSCPHARAARSARRGTPIERQHSIASSSGPSPSSSSPPNTRDPDPLGVEAEALGRQLVGELDGALLEVVADREVAEHLEEGEVPRGQADVLDVGGAEALLARGQPLRRRLLLAPEVRLERLHARGREQHATGRKLAGTSDAEGMRLCPRSSKNDRNRSRISAAVIARSLGRHRAEPRSKLERCKCRSGRSFSSVQLLHESCAIHAQRDRHGATRRTFPTCSWPSNW